MHTFNFNWFVLTKVSLQSRFAYMIYRGVSGPVSYFLEVHLTYCWSDKHATSGELWVSI